MAAEDGSSYHAVRKEEKLLDRLHLTEHLLDGAHIVACDRYIVLRTPKFYASSFSKARPVDPGVIDGSTHCEAVEAVEEVEQHCKLAVDD